jgi:hypothetical protein
MERITENSKLAVRGSWAALNHSLAVELEKRAAHPVLKKAGESAWSLWFSPEFVDEVTAAVFDFQVEVDPTINELFDLASTKCCLTAWRYLHDLVYSATPPYVNDAFEARRLRFLDAMERRWHTLISQWNGKPKAFKELVNNKYKGLIEGILASDFSPHTVSNADAEELADLNVLLCDEVLALVRITLAKKIRPIHLYAMVETLEFFGFLPRRKRQLITRFLGMRYGVRVRENYRPDPSRHRYKEGDEPGNAVVDYSLAIDATNEAIVKLNIRPKGYVEYYRLA